MVAGRIAHVAANAVWSDIDWARDKLIPFAGRTVHLVAWPIPGSTMRVGPDGQWEDASGLSAAAADVRLRLSPAILPRLASAPDLPGSAIDGDGDPEFLKVLRDLGDVLPLAFEERLSSALGPLAAHGITTTLRALAGWPAIAAGRLSAGAAAFFTEETRALVKRSTFASFSSEVAEISARTERLEASCLQPPQPDSSAVTTA